MKHLYKQCNLHDFHMLLNSLSVMEYNQFIENEISHMLHHLALTYYNLINHMYEKNYPILSIENKKMFYSIFWDYCKYYFMIQKRLCLLENSFLL